MERIVMDEMIEFLLRNNLLSEHQHGFKKYRSCLSELLSHHNRILEALLKGENYDTLYLDYQKAFDRCDQGVAAHAIRTPVTWAAYTKLRLLLPDDFISADFGLANEVP